MNLRSESLSSRRQKGSVAAIGTIAMVAIVGMAGYALDMGHLYLNKTRVQNLVDVSALSAARVLKNTDNPTSAEAAARELIATNLAISDFDELKGISAEQISVEFSKTLDPFNSGGANPDYVRVSISDVALSVGFIAALGIVDKRVGARAVAGPSPTLALACNVVPLLLCQGDDTTANLFGYNFGDSLEIKSAAPGADELGGGNFKLLRLEGDKGAADLAVNLAGSYNACLNLNQSTLNTEPGNKVGKVFQGLNSRFGIYGNGNGGGGGGGGGNANGNSGNDEDTEVTNQITEANYPPDRVTNAGNNSTYDDDTYASYRADYASGSYDEANGVDNRRILAVPVGDCDGDDNGQTTLPYVGMACMFLEKPATHSGNDQTIYGELIEEGCNISGIPGDSPGDGNGPYIIQLYEDVSTQDS